MWKSWHRNGKKKRKQAGKDGSYPVLPHRTLRGAVTEPQAAEPSDKAGAFKKCRWTSKACWNEALSLELTSLHSHNF